MAPTTLVLDYGIARARPLMAALEAAGVPALLTSNHHDVRSADRLVLPDGDDDDRALERGIRPELLDAVQKHIEGQKPLLAIGLGLLFLLTGNTHARMPAGIETFRSHPMRFDPRMADENERPLKSPHTGFGLVVGLDRHPQLGAILPEDAPGAWFYFRHRLCSPARVAFAEVAVAHHGVPFAGAIWKDNVTALQFLPELSGPLGIRVLEAWSQDPAA